MKRILDMGQPVTLSGRSGALYYGTIYNKCSDESFSGHAIVCLTNSIFHDHQWIHIMNSIFRTNNAKAVLLEFKKRDDISHLVMISQHPFQVEATDTIDDLIRHYIHQGTQKI